MIRKCLDPLKSVYNTLKCVSMNNQERKLRPEILIIMSKKPLFYPDSVKKMQWQL